MTAPSAHQFAVVEGGHGPIGNQYDPTRAGCSCGWQSDYLCSTRPDAWNDWLHAHAAEARLGEMGQQMAWDEAHADGGMEGPL